MHSEITTGENPVLTSFVGASAPPNHVEAAIAQKTPSPCIDRITGTVFAVVKGILGVMRFGQVLQELLGRLGAMDLPVGRRSSHSGIHQSIAPRIGETRQIYATRLNGVKQYLFRVVPPTAAMPENKPSRNILLSPSLNFSSFGLARATGSHVRRRVTITSWWKSAGLK
jgi:hypothetical protein